MSRVRALFTIDGTTPDEVFDGWYNPDYTWNGWVAPSFDRATAELVIAWVRKGYEGSDVVYTSFEWDGDVLLQFDRNDGGLVVQTTRIEPDADGRYAIGDGWTWDTVEVPEGKELGPWLAHQDALGSVHALANNEMIRVGMPGLATVLATLAVEAFEQNVPDNWSDLNDDERLKLKWLAVRMGMVSLITNDPTAYQEDPNA